MSIIDSSSFEVTVCIPVRNRKRELNRALDSLCSQQLLPKIVIVIDDCSTDDTVESIGQRIDDPFPITVLKLDVRGGAPAARNAGLSLVETEFVSFLDSDDEFTPQHLSVHAEAMIKNSKCIATFTRSIYTYENGHTFSPRRYQSVSTSDLHEKNALGATSCAVIRTSYMKQINGFDNDLPSCQDWDLWIRLSECGPLVSLDQKTIVYRFDGNDRISKSIERLITGHRMLFSKIYKNKSTMEIRKLEIWHDLWLANIITFNFPRNKEAYFLYFNALRKGDMRQRLEAILRLVKMTTLGGVQLSQIKSLFQFRER